MLQMMFFPVWSGDFRLERGEDGNCVLTVEDPTEADKKLLKPFLAKAKERKWLDELAGIQPTGITVLPLKAAMEEASPLLAHALHGDAETWVAIRHTNGTVTLENGAELVAVEPGEEPAKLPATADLAAVIKPPRKGCPAPAASHRRASEVLRAFCTESQWDQWQREGRLRALGSRTGQSYFIYHRDEAAQRGLSHSLVEVDSNRAICTWDDTVPPEEEALSIKLAVEHRETWLRSMGNAPIYA